MGKLYGLNARRILSLLLLGYSIISFSQTYQFRNYSINDNDQGYVYTINQDSKGFIWLGTGTGIVRYDGFRLQPVELTDMPSRALPLSSLTAKDGTIYFGFSDGKIFRQEEGTVVEIEGCDAFRINGIIEDADNRIIFVSQSKGLFRFDPGKQGKIEKIPSPIDEPLYCAAFTEKG